MLRRFQGISILILLLVVIVDLIIFKVDRVSDVVGVLLDEVLKLPAVRILLTFLVEGEDKGGTLLLTLSAFDRIGGLSV